MKFCVAPTLGDQVAGVSAMDRRVGVVTVTEVEPLMVPRVAAMVVDPAATARTRTPVLLEVTVATAVSLEAQLACAVTSPVVPSE